MRLLMFTRKVDSQDDRVGFVSDWIFALSQNLEKLMVICQEQGDLSDLPSNVRVFSLGKERGYSKFKQLIKSQFLTIKQLPRVDGVFVHMIPHYAVLAGPWCKIFKKKLIQWYAHGSIPWSLKMANLFVNEYLTSSQAGFPYQTRKPVKVIGQGININKFKIQNHGSQVNQKFNILSIGRISPVKNYDLLIRVIANIELNDIELRNQIKLKIIGAPATLSQHSYYKKLEEQVTSQQLDSLIDFLGPLPQEQILSHLASCNLFINLSDTGSLDKAVLEAMASGKLVLTTNPAYSQILPEPFFTNKKDIDTLCHKIKYLYTMSPEEKQKWSQILRQEVVTNHNLTNLAQKIINSFK